MPNATVRANAQAMPIDRRTALGSLAAAGALLAVPRPAKAEGVEPEIAAAIARIQPLQQALIAAENRLDALEAQYVEPPPSDELMALADDRYSFGATAQAGEVLTPEDIEAAEQRYLQMRTVADSPTMHPSARKVFERVRAVFRAGAAWRDAKEAENARLGIPEAIKASDAAAHALHDALDALTEPRPRTVAGLAAVARTLLEASEFEGHHQGEALARAVLHLAELEA